MSMLGSPITRAQMYWQLLTHGEQPTRVGIQLMKVRPHYHLVFLRHVPHEQAIQNHNIASCKVRGSIENWSYESTFRNLYSVVRPNLIYHTLLKHGWPSLDAANAAAKTSWAGGHLRNLLPRFAVPIVRVG